MNTISEVEIKLRPSAQTKLILERALVGKAAKASADTLIELLDIASYSVQSIGTRAIRDEYFDTDSLEFHSKGASCRVRHVGDHMDLTIKWRKPQPITAGKGLFEREERTHKLTHLEYLAMLETGMLPVAWRDIEPLENRNLILVCEIANSRRDFRMTRNGEIFQLSVDRCSFSDLSENYRRSEDFVEVEIEALNDIAQSGAAKLRETLAKISKQHEKFEFSTSSKYSEAIKALGIGRSFLAKELIRKSPDAGIAIALSAFVASVPLAMGYIIGGCLTFVLFMSIFLLFIRFKKV